MNLVGVEVRAPARLSAFRDCGDILEYPVTGEPLIATEDGWVSRSGRRYPIEEGIIGLCSSAGRTRFRPTPDTTRTRSTSPMLAVWRWQNGSPAR
jgi:hypothetical protein